MFIHSSKIKNHEKSTNQQVDIKEKFYSQLKDSFYQGRTSLS